MASSTYTPSDSTAHPGQQFFQNVEITPASLADGTLYAALDPKTHPQLGVLNDSVAGAASVVLTLLPTTPAAGDSVTLIATVHSGIDGEQPVGTVAFSSLGGALGTSGIVAGVANDVLGGGFATGSHTLTATWVEKDVISAPVVVVVA